MNICDMCGFVAKTKKMFTQHKKTHDTGFFSCDICQKNFTMLQSLRDIKNLDKHIKNCKKYNLSNEKYFVCSGKNG